MRLVVTSSFAALAALGAFRTVPAVPADVPADVPAQADAARGAFATRNFPAAPVPPAAYSAGAGSLRDARYHTPRADKVRGASASRYLPAAPVPLAASYPARTRSDGREIGAVLTTPAVETDYSAGQILTWPYQRASPAAVFSIAETNNDVGDLEAVFASFGLDDPQKDWDREPNLFPPCPFGTKAVPVSALPLPETLAYGRYYSEHRDFQRISDNLRTFVESAQHLIDSAVGHVESVNPWIAGKQTGITGDLPATRWKTIGYMQILVTNVVVKAVGFLGVRRHFLPNPNRKDTILLLKALLCGTSQLPKGPVGSALLSTSIWDLTDVSIVKLWPQVIDHISKLVDYVTISIVPFDRYKKWAADLKVNAAVLKGMLDNLHTGGHNAALARQQLLQNSYNDVGQSPGFPLVFGATPEGNQILIQVAVEAARRIFSAASVLFRHAALAQPPSSGIYSFSENDRRKHLTDLHFLVAKTMTGDRKLLPPLPLSFDEETIRRYFLSVEISLYAALYALLPADTVGGIHSLYGEGKGDIFQAMDAFGRCISESLYKIVKIVRFFSAHIDVSTPGGAVCEALIAGAMESEAVVSKIADCYRAHQIEMCDGLIFAAGRYNDYFAVATYYKYDIMSFV